MCFGIFLTTILWHGSFFLLLVKVFSETFSKMLEHTAPGREAARSPMSLRQGRRSTCDYDIDFCTLAAESDCNGAALFNAFLTQLADSIKDFLILLEHFKGSGFPYYLGIQDRQETKGPCCWEALTQIFLSCPGGHQSSSTPLPWINKSPAFLAAASAAVEVPMQLGWSVCLQRSDSAIWGMGDSSTVDKRDTSWPPAQ